MKKQYLFYKGIMLTSNSILNLSLRLMVEKFTFILKQQIHNVHNLTILRVLYFWNELISDKYTAFFLQIKKLEWLEDLNSGTGK